MFEVQNQPPPLEPYNLFSSDTVSARGGRARGRRLGRMSWNAGRQARQAGDRRARLRRQQIPPQLRTLDRYRPSRRRGRIPSGLARAVSNRLRAGLHSSPWAKPQKPGAHVARAAGTYMLTQIESGVYCPVAMTYGSVPTLRAGARHRQGMAAADFFAQLRRRFRRPARENGGACRHGHDRKPGRLGSAQQHDARGAQPAAASACRGINGSCRRRCATPFSSLHNRQRA